MNVVSFETAKRLKAAGFPWLDKIPFGQFCYSLSGFLFRYKGGEKNKRAYFAPSATDILRELDSSHSLLFQKSNGLWYCKNEGLAWKSHENPAEACAAAWLSVHEKTANQ